MLLPEAGIEPIGILPPGVISGLRIGGGKRVLVLMNFTDAPKRAWVNGTGGRDVLDEQEVGNEVLIAARGVRVLTSVP
jgi:hypothetical protein